MAHQRTHGISAFLHLLHETPEYTGLADVHARHARVLPNVRTIYRWQRRASIAHYPNILYKCLGLVRCHVIAPPERLSLGGGSLDGLWRTIHASLRDRVWQYLPRGGRALRQTCTHRKNYKVQVALAWNARRRHRDRHYGRRKSFWSELFD